jgi:multicomponent Na+:H+ antiporter subunit D
MNLLLVLPLLVPLGTAAAALLLRRWRRAQRVLGITGTAVLLAVGAGLLDSVWTNGIQVAQIGNWPAPFGITLVADLFSAVMVLLTGLMGFAVAVYSLVTVDRRRESFGYYPLLLILLMGVCGAFLTGDLFNLYVWFEVMLIASFVLLALGGERAQIEGAIKYVTLNLLSSALFLAAVGVLYGIAGTLNMADLAVTLREETNAGLVTTVAVLFLAAFGIKAAVFPLFFWLPASYHTPPAAVSAIFAGLLTKVGVYALIRVFTLLFVQDTSYTHDLILVIAALTMLSGVLGAIAQVEFRRVLSFQVISTIGYMLMGLGILTPLALAGSVFYIIQDVVVKTNLFLISGVTQRLFGTNALPRMGGLYGRSPLLAVLFFIPALSLAGVPPLSGFFAKLALVEAGLDAERYVLVAVALIVSPLTLLSMTRIWAEVFWKPDPAKKDKPAAERSVDPSPTSPSPARFRTRRWGLLGPIVVLTGITVVLGLVAEPVFTLAQRAADQLLDPSAYIDAVLGGMV